MLLYTVILSLTMPKIHTCFKAHAVYIVGIILIFFFFINSTNITFITSMVDSSFQINSYLCHVTFAHQNIGEFSVPFFISCSYISTLFPFRG